MRVKTAELKANLSRYVRHVRESGEPVEIFLRDELVAYLTPAEGAHHLTPDEMAKQRDLESSFSEAGLICQLARPAVKIPAVNPSVAGDGREDRVTVAELRAEKAW